MPKSTRPTNVEFVTELMEYSPYGGLAQIFIIDAITKYANLVAEAKEAEVDHPMISGHAWIGCARDIKARLDAMYSSERKQPAVAFLSDSDTRD